MALVSCPDCKTQVSEVAPTCPKCGRPIAPGSPRGINAGLFAALVVGALVVAGVTTAVVLSREAPADSASEAARDGAAAAETSTPLSLLGRLDDEDILRRENEDLQARNTSLQLDLSDAQERLASAAAELEDMKRPFEVLESACNWRCPDGFFGVCLRAECNVRNPRSVLGASRVIGRMERFGKPPMEKYKDVAIGPGQATVVAIDFPEVESVDQNVRCNCRVESP